MSFSDAEIAAMIKSHRATFSWAVTRDREQITATRVCSAEFREQIAARGRREMKEFEEHLIAECSARGITHSDALEEEALEVKRQIEGRGMF